MRQSYSKTCWQECNEYSKSQMRHIINSALLERQKIKKIWSKFQTDKQKIQNYISIYQFSIRKNRHNQKNISTAIHQSQERSLFNNKASNQIYIIIFITGQTDDLIFGRHVALKIFQETLYAPAKLKSNQQIQQGMTSNNISRSYSTCNDPVFIQKDQHVEIHEMRKILSSGSVQDIKNFFFTSPTSSDLNICGVTQNQIKKHSQVLDHRNKSYLKQLLKHRKENKETPSQFKGFNQQRTISQANQKDGEIQQYLQLNYGQEFFGCEGNL